MASTTDVVQNYQSMFAYRYTAEDKEYQKYLQHSAISPPLIEDWMNRSGCYIFLILNFVGSAGPHNYAVDTIKAEPKSR